MCRLDDAGAGTALQHLQASSCWLQKPKLAGTRSSGVCSSLGLLGASVFVFMPWFIQTESFSPTFGAFWSSLDMAVTGTFRLCELFIPLYVIHLNLT